MRTTSRLIPGTVLAVVEPAYLTDPGLQSWWAPIRAASATGGLVAALAAIRAAETSR